MDYEMKRGDIYYADLSGTIGCEQGGIRPVVIIQNDTGNTFSPTTIVAPLTSKQKKALPTHVYLRRAEKSGLRKESLISMEQIRTIDKSRIKGYIGKADDNTVQQINRAKIYWVCRNHKDNGNKCPAKQIPEYAIYDAFVRMFNKLKTNRSAVLNPVISQLEKLSIILKSGNEQAMKIQSEITQLREQSYQLSRLNTMGILTDSIYASKRTELDGKMENLRKELISVSTTDETDKQIEQLSFLSSIIDDEDMQTDFAPNLFGQIVTKITALDSDTIRFTLHGGIEFNESIIREKR